MVDSETFIKFFIAYANPFNMLFLLQIDRYIVLNILKLTLLLVTFTVFVALVQPCPFL